MMKKYLMIIVNITLGLSLLLGSYLVSSGQKKDSKDLNKTIDSLKIDNTKEMIKYLKYYDVTKDETYFNEVSGSLIKLSSNTRLQALLEGKNVSELEYLIKLRDRVNSDINKDDKGNLDALLKIDFVSSNSDYLDIYGKYVS